MIYDLLHAMDDLDDTTVNAVWLVEVRRVHKVRKEHTYLKLQEVLMGFGGDVARGMMFLAELTERTETTEALKTSRLEEMVSAPGKAVQHDSYWKQSGGWTVGTSFYAVQPKVPPPDVMRGRIFGEPDILRGSLVLETTASMRFKDGREIQIVKVLNRNGDVEHAVVFDDPS